MDRRTPWWKYEKPTLREARQTYGWMWLVFGAITGLQSLFGSTRQYAGIFAMAYLFISAWNFWMSTRAKD